MYTSATYARTEINWIKKIKYWKKNIEKYWKKENKYKIKVWLLTCLRGKLKYFHTPKNRSKLDLCLHIIIISNIDKIKKNEKWNF